MPDAVRTLAEHVVQSTMPYGWEVAPSGEGGELHSHLVNQIADTLRAYGEQRYQEGCSSSLADAKHRGYLDHKQECRKGVDSETCTCGIMEWLPTAISGEK